MLPATEAGEAPVSKEYAALAAQLLPEIKAMGTVPTGANQTGQISFFHTADDVDKSLDVRAPPTAALMDNL